MYINRFKSFIDTWMLLVLKYIRYIISSDDHLTFRLGFSIAERPWQTIGFCWLVVALCCLGFTKFENERDPLKLWIPQNSEFLRNTKWIIEKFKEGTRVQRFVLDIDFDYYTCVHNHIYIIFFLFSLFNLLEKIIIQLIYVII